MPVASASNALPFFATVQSHRRRQAVTERIRLAAEQCMLRNDERPYRDTASWRAALREKLWQRTQMEAETLRLRACMTQALHSDALKRCISVDDDRAPSSEAWQRWLTIYENRNRP